MADRTGIEWTDATWNPVRGCARVSDGCRHCYAERVAARFARPGQPYEGLIHQKTGGWNGSVMLVPDALQIPWRWTRPRRIFVNSMSDLFHPDVPFEFIAAVFFIMSVTTRHTYQILTKRPERMLEFFQWVESGKGVFDDDRISDVGMDHPAVRALGWEPQRGRRGGYDNCGPSWPYANVWMGVSVENQATADARVPFLLQCPATVRWISAEPLLGPVDLEQLAVPSEHDQLRTPGSWEASRFNALRVYDEDRYHQAPAVLDWVIAGGESGPGARPMHPDWARSLRDQCAAAGVPFLFKQWGEWSPGSQRGKPDAAVLTDGRVLHDWTAPAMEAANRAAPVPPCRPEIMARVGKKCAGRVLDGTIHDEYPAVRA